MTMQKQRIVMRRAILYDLSLVSHPYTPEYLHCILRSVLNIDSYLAWVLYTQYIKPRLQELIHGAMVRPIHTYRSTHLTIDTGWTFHLLKAGRAALDVRPWENLPLAGFIAEHLSQYQFQQHLFQAIDDTTFQMYPTPEAESRTPLEELLAHYHSSDFDPDMISDERTRIRSMIVQRQGQAHFRTILIDLYDQQCAITRYTAVDALEAAHIIPYNGTATNHPTNGLLLRADIHTLFDLGLIVVDPQTLHVEVAPALRRTEYAPLQGTAFYEPMNVGFRISRKALELHYAWAKSTDHWH